jgi:hypothetical protein
MLFPIANDVVHSITKEIMDSRLTRLEVFIFQAKFVNLASLAFYLEFAKIK